MVVVEEVVSVLPPWIADNIGVFINILKAVGVFFIIYLIYMIVNGFFMFKRIKRMKRIEKTVNSIDKKLDILLKDRKKKRK